MSKDEAKVVSESFTSVLYELIRDALTTHRVKTTEHTEYYLIHLLEGFARSQPALTQPLGPELLSAGSLEPVRRYYKLKEVADTTLFLSGMFLDHLEVQTAATDYFFGIGSSAYLHLSSLDEQNGPNQPFADTYNDLGRRFEEFVRVLCSISDSELFGANDRALELYGRWLRGGTERDAQRLITMGIIPANGDPAVKH